MENRNIFQVYKQDEKSVIVAHDMRNPLANEPGDLNPQINPESQVSKDIPNVAKDEDPNSIKGLKSRLNTKNGIKSNKPDHEIQGNTQNYLNQMNPTNLHQYQNLGPFPQSNFPNSNNLNFPASESNLFYQTYLTGLSMNLTIEEMVNQNILPVKKNTRNVKINGKDYLESKYPSISQIQRKFSRPDVPIDVKPGSIFYIIKSFNIENIHKAIKYKVWSTTYQGNILFDNAFHEAQQCKGEVYLFFSTNSTFAFQGIAKLKSGFQSKSFNFWRGSDKIQKFTGSFLIEWVIIKDVPNSTLDKILINGIPFSKLRNGVQVNEVDAIRVIKIFETFYYCSSIVLSDFPNLDKEEERLNMEYNSKK